MQRLEDFFMLFIINYYFDVLHVEFFFNDSLCCCGLKMICGMQYQYIFYV